MTRKRTDYLCERCEGISFDALGESRGHEHYPNVGMLRDEAHREHGCSLCILLWWSLRYDRHALLDHLPVKLYLNPPFQYSSQVQQLEVVVASAEKLAAFGWAPGAPNGPWQLGPPEYVAGVFRGALTLYGIHGDAANDIFRHKLVETDPASDKCLGIAEHWFESCFLNHTQTCGRTTGNFLPKRLIDVGPGDGSQSPRLWIPSEHSSGFHDGCALPRYGRRYATLSYCWGAKSFFALKSSTIESLKSCIRMESLPRTIRDAITIVRRLDIRYLWVDSLCILQGSDKEARDDWAQESANMNHIYQEALLTIAATGSGDAYQGIFQPRVKQMPHCLVEYSSRASPEIRGLVSIGPSVTEHPGSPAPLNSRGWALQEKILSRRILEYGTTEMVWTCRYHKLTEGSTKMGTNTDSNARIYRASTSMGDLGLMRQEVKSISLRWRSIVEDYTSRELTRTSDKLPALAGLARLIQDFSDDKYFAGLWQSQLLQQILWKHLGKIVNGRREYPRPPHFRAPSWTWASVDGKVEFCDSTAAPQSHRKLTRAPMRILSCKVISTLPSGLGEISGGELVVHGLIKKVDTIRCEPIGRYYGCYENYFPWIGFPDGLTTYLDNVDGLPQRVKKLVPDAPKELFETYFFFVESDLSTGLILLKVNSGPAGIALFTRIGLFEGYRYKAQEIKNREIGARIIRIN